jgi:hypothetical protein
MTPTKQEKIQILLSLHSVLIIHKQMCSFLPLRCMYLS